jgi:peptidoglycan hydrolase CwlO-like protein
MQPAPASSLTLNEVFAELLDDLNRAYWAASTLAAKDQIKGVLEIVADAITTIDATDLSTKNAAYAALGTEVVSVNKQLQKLQAEIDGLISDIKTATAVVSDITQAVSVAAKMFP